MCGIAGYWQSEGGGEHPAEVLARMGAALEHRGPDDSGTFHDRRAGIGLAFRRLAILDLSPQGHQPMISASGRYVIIFNGEVYNFAEIRDELGAGRWRGGSDTEVMLAAIERWGLEAAVQRFVGMFAFALWDTEERKLQLVRDRLGIKPLYYGRAGGDFVFGSELKAIVQHPEFAGQVDRDALALYLRHNYVPAPHCIYQGLNKLPPGRILTLRSAGGFAQIGQYWPAKEAAQGGSAAGRKTSDGQAVEELHSLLWRAVRLRMISDVPLGAFLSGGVDSSTVVALMQAQSGRAIKTFTIGFHEDGYDEAAQARKVAARLGTEHTELYVGFPEACQAVPLLAGMYDEPFADSSQVPTYLVSKLARRQVTVCLSGDGGDEIFGGYERYRMIPKIWKASRRIPQSWRMAAAGLLQGIPPRLIDRGYRGIEALLPQRLRLGTPGQKLQKLGRMLGGDSPEALYYQALSHWSEPEQVVLGGCEPDTVRSSVEESRCRGSIEQTMMLSDLRNYLPDDILTKLDRASMAVSLEARPALLDHRVVEFALSLPLRMKIRGGQGKWILRQVLERYLPREFFKGPKRGFAVPLDSWLRGPLRDWAETLLEERRLRSEGFFRAGPIGKMWAAHLRGEGSWQHCLWDVLMFQAWREAHAKNAARPARAASSAVLQGQAIVSE